MRTTTIPVPDGLALRQALMPRRLSRRRHSRRHKTRQTSGRRQTRAVSICTGAEYEPAEPAAAGLATASRFTTWETVGSKRATRSAKSRSCSDATVPRSTTVRPCTQPSGPSQNAAPAASPSVQQAAVLT